MSKQMHLNHAVNLFGLNKKKNVGDLNTAISVASPFTEAAWETYYYDNVMSKESLMKLGSELFRKIREVILPEIQSISEADCKAYINDLVITKTFAGRRARYEIFHGLLLEATGKEFKFLPDEAEHNPQDWRPRTFKIDYYFPGDDSTPLIGIKVCPQTMASSRDLFVVQARQEIERDHQEWEEKEAGRFFILYYTADRQGIQIANPAVLAEIRDL
jgi:MjaI restriction endonuclease